jgi:hypothetical protein
MGLWTHSPCKKVEWERFPPTHIHSRKATRSKKAPVSQPGRGPDQDPAMLAPGSWTCRLLNHEKINFFLKPLHVWYPVVASQSRTRQLIFLSSLLCDAGIFCFLPSKPILFVSVTHKSLFLSLWDSPWWVQGLTVLAAFNDSLSSQVREASLPCKTQKTSHLTHTPWRVGQEGALSLTCRVGAHQRGFGVWSSWMTKLVAMGWFCEWVMTNQCIMQSVPFKCCSMSVSWWTLWTWALPPPKHMTFRKLLLLWALANPSMNWPQIWKWM